MSIFNNLIPTLSRPAAVTSQEAGELNETVKPAYEIKETPEAFGVTVYLPGVAKDGLEVTAEEGQIRIIGRRAWNQPEAWTALYRETQKAPFELVLTHE